VGVGDMAMKECWISGEKWAQTLGIWNLRDEKKVSIHFRLCEEKVMFFMAMAT
jgi:hypothetical protein